MKFLRLAIARLRGLLRGDLVTKEIDDEFRSHLEMLVETNIERGMTPDEARRHAMKSFGSINRVRGAAYDVKGGGVLEVLWQDLQFAFRVLVKRPAFASIVILTLALGIGTTTAIFSVVNGVLLRPLPYADEARIVTVEQSNRHNPALREGVSPANFLDMREQARSFEAIAAAEQLGFTLTGDGEPEAIRGWIVTRGFFDILNSNALYGRTFLTEEYEPGHEQVVVLGYGLWQRRFGGDPQVIGRKLTFNNQPFTVVGVMRPEFQYPPNRELWAPRPGRSNDTQTRGGSLFRVTARLKTGVTIDQTELELAAISEGLSRQYPSTNSDVTTAIQPLREKLVGRLRLPLLLILGAVSLVLLIACANVANLFLVRAAEREHEFALRAALGAGGNRLFRQLLTESLLLAIPGGLAGLMLSVWLIRLIVAYSPDNLFYANQITLDRSVSLFSIGISILTGILFGLAPAIQAMRANLQTVLNNSSRTKSSGARHQRFRNSLVVGEIALAVIVLVGAGLLMRSFVALRQNELGFSSGKGLALEIQLGRRQPAERIVYFDQVLSKLSALPGVQATAVSSALPFHDNQVALQTAIGFLDAAATLGSEPTAFLIRTSADYFHALDVPLVQGRVFTQFDKGDSAPVAIVNNLMARRFWPTESPIGRKIAFEASGRNVTAEIIGVVGDVRATGFDSEPRPEVYLPYQQSPAPLVTLFVRTSNDPAALLPAVKEKIREINPNEAFLSINTIDQLMDRTIAQRRFNMLLLVAFAGLALVLAAIGLYGLISFSTAQRTHEIGIRMSLGAQQGEVLKLVVGQGLKLYLVGLTIGLIGAVALTRLMTSLLFGVSATDPITLLAVASMLSVVSLLASYIPARRAVKIDPIEALRYE